MSLSVRFRTRLVAGHKDVTALIVPFDPSRDWPDIPAVALDARRQGWLIAGTVNGTAFLGWIGQRWGRNFIIIDAELRARAGIAVGDAVEVVVQPTQDPKALDIARVQAAVTTAARRRAATAPAKRLAIRPRAKRAPVRRRR